MVAPEQQLELISLPQSPFSLKARWALQYHGIPFRVWSYTPILGETWMKAKAGKLFSKDIVSSPVLLKKDGNLYNSAAIARWADGHGVTAAVPPLFPRGRDADIQRWEALADATSSVGRQYLLKFTQNNKEGILALMPPAVRDMPLVGRPMALAMGRYIMGSLLKKYDAVDAQAGLVKVQEGLREFRKALHAAGGKYVLGTFSYADLTMAVLLRPLCMPGAPRQVPSAQATVPFPVPVLYEEFKDLQPWADSIFDTHFPAKPAPAA